MNSKLRQWMLLSLLALIGLGTAACNTTRGVGEDLEEAGEEIQEEVNE